MSDIKPGYVYSLRLNHARRGDSRFELPPVEAVAIRLVEQDHWELLHETLGVVTAPPEDLTPATDESYRHLVEAFRERFAP